MSELQKEMAKAGKYMKKAGKELESIGKSLTLGVTLPIIGIGAVAVKAASDLEETNSKFNAVFGDMSDTVGQFAKDFAIDFGRSTQEVKENLAVIQTVGKNYGLTAQEASGLSQNMLSLANDVAAFTNTDLSDASTRMTAALRGEGEAAEALGFSINQTTLAEYARSQGITESISKMSQAELVNLRYGLMAQQAGDMVGYAEKEQGSFTAQLARAKGVFTDLAATMGQVILPVITAVMTKINEFIEKNFEWITSNGETIVKFLAVAAAIGPVIFLIGKLVSTVSAVMLWGSGVAKAIALVSAGTKGIGVVFTAVFGPAGIVLLVVAAVAALVAGIMYLWKNNEDFRNAVIKIWQAVYKALEPIILATKEMLLSTWEAIKAVLTVVWNVIKNVATGIFNSLTDFWSKWGGTIKGVFSGIWTAVESTFKAAIGIISGLMKIITGIFTGDWNKALSGMKQIASSIWEGIKGIFRGGANALISVINGMIGGLNKLKVNIPSWVPGLGGKSFGLSIPKIPMLAEGGIISKATLAMVGEGSESEAVMPLSKLQHLLDLNKEGKGSGETNYNSPLFVIENFHNDKGTDIENLMYELEFYRRKAAKALGGE